MTRQKRKEVPAAKILVAILIVVLGVSFYVFLNTSDGYGQYQITGKEVLARMSTSFWVFVVLGLVISIILFLAAYFNESGEWIGQNMRGSTGLTILLCILGLSTLICPWIPALEAKANGGATLPKQTTTYEDNHDRSYNSTTYWCSVSDPTHGISVEG